MGEGRRGLVDERRGETTGYSHVGIVWGTPRVNADAVGHWRRDENVDTRARAPTRVCKFSGNICFFAKTKNSWRSGRNFSREEKYFDCNVSLLNFIASSGFAQVFI